MNGLWRVSRLARLGLVLSLAGCFEAKFDVSDRVNARVKEFNDSYARMNNIVDRQGDQYQALIREAVGRVERIVETSPETARKISQAFGEEMRVAFARGSRYAEHRLTKRLDMVFATIQSHKAARQGKKVDPDTLAKTIRDALASSLDAPFVEGLAERELVVGDDTPELTLTIAGYGLTNTAGQPLQVVAGNHTAGTVRVLTGVPLARNPEQATATVRRQELTAADTYVGVRHGPLPHECVRVPLTFARLDPAKVVTSAKLRFKTLGAKSAFTHLDVEVRQSNLIRHAAPPQPFPPAGWKRLEEFESVKVFRGRRHDEVFTTTRRSSRHGGVNETYHPVTQQGFFQYDYHPNLHTPHYFAYAQTGQAPRPIGDPGERIRQYWDRGIDGHYEMADAHWAATRAWAESLGTGGTTGQFAGLSENPNTPPLVYNLPAATLDLAKPVELHLRVRGTRQWTGCVPELVLTTKSGGELVFTGTAIDLTPNGANAVTLQRFDLPAGLRYPPASAK